MLLEQSTAQLDFSSARPKSNEGVFRRLSFRIGRWSALGRDDLRVASDQCVDHIQGSRLACQCNG